VERILEILEAAIEAKAKTEGKPIEGVSLSIDEEIAAVKAATSEELPGEPDIDKARAAADAALGAATKAYREVKGGPKNTAALRLLRLAGARKDVFTEQVNALKDWDDTKEGSGALKEDPEETDEEKTAREAKEAEAAEAEAKQAEIDKLKESDPDAAKAAQEKLDAESADETKAAEERAASDAAAEQGSLEDEEEVGPRELISATARGRRRKVKASALGSGRSGIIRGKRDARRQVSPITAGATGEHGKTGNEVSFMEFGADLQDAIAWGANGNDLKIVASVNPYGRPSEWDGDQVLGNDATKNHEILFGGREDLSVTAAVCGPAEPIREIQTCFTADTPVLDSLTMRQAMYGQIQVYAPASLPEGMTGIMLPAPDCENCPGDAKIDCLKVECEDPLEPHKATPIQACLCVSESLAFSAEFILESYMELLSARYAQVLEIQRLQAVRAQSWNRTFRPPYGAAAGIVQAAAQVMHLISNNSRYTGPVDDYQIVIPRGTSYTMLADLMNRVFGCDHALDDYLAALSDLGISTIIQTLDADGQHCGVAEGNVPMGFTGPVGPEGCAPLEPFHQSPSIYIYRKDSFLTASPFELQVGIDSREKHEIEQGCVRMIQRQYWIPPVKFGCAPSIVLDFDAMCASGTGPDMTDPVGCDMEGGDNGAGGEKREGGFDMEAAMQRIAAMEAAMEAGGLVVA